MIQIKKILVATDFSENAEGTLAAARTVASGMGATVDLVNVIPTLTYMNESLKSIGAPIDLESELFPKIIKEREEQGLDYLKRFIPEENRGEVIVRVDRKPSQFIVTQASEHNYDLVVIGARGRDDTRLLRGGTTQRVIRRSEVPVLCVPKDFKTSEINNILVPTDASRVSFCALPQALIMSKLFGADLTLFHVIELYGTALEDMPHQPGKEERESLYERLIINLNNWLAETDSGLTIVRTDVPFEDQLVDTDKDPGVHPPIRLSTYVGRGVSAHLEIEAYADDNTDMVVIATHGHSGLTHFFLGSTTERVVQTTQKPVLTIRPKPEG